ncbi:methylated-dna-protein-cysteine methyltransferase [Venturia nashicola]|uniref:Methylated-dna-protein-cysteine methyltransferase n=1 Tax=Venturia nashicola TaxID=86259 RepID=A0A4Z1NKV3_9PEZI|nr:methylated-dna-protein-cysteine methyltransferase [Venturia nashicola]
MMVTSVRPSLGLKRSNGGRVKSQNNKSEPTPSTSSSILSYFSPHSLGRTNDANKPSPSPSLQAQETQSTSVELAAGECSSPSSSSAIEVVETEPQLPPPPPPAQPPKTLSVPTQTLPRTKTPTRNGTRLRLTVRDPNSGASTPKSRNATPQPGNNTTGASSSSSRETRTLRSKDGSLRIKSDLSLYFAYYEDILLNGLDQNTEFLRADEPIYILEEKIWNPAKPKQPAVFSQPSALLAQSAVPPSPHSNVSNAKTIAAPSLPSSTSSPADDPLPDSIFLKCHGRAERKEKQARNIEKERAQHEKENLERLLEGLQGPDWLRVMGITGITEGDQKSWKPKRDYFISEVLALVERFRTWKEEEKRMRQAKERAREEEDEDEDDEEEDNESDVSSDVDASASRQLQIEAGLKPRPRAKRKRTSAAPAREVKTPPPMTSFYKAPHLRAQAMGETRTSRHMTAFGEPIPDFDEQDFELPEDYITPEALRANARKRRRRNRELKDVGGNSEVSKF